MKKSALLAFVPALVLGTVGCSGADHADTQVLTATRPDGSVISFDPAFAYTLEVPAGKVVSFTYGYKGEKENRVQIHDLTFDRVVPTEGNYRVGNIQRTVTLPVQATAIKYVVTGYSKPCWWSDECSRRQWAQEPYRVHNPQTIGFEDSDEVRGDYGDSYVTWTIFNP